MTTPPTEPDVSRPKRIRARPLVLADGRRMTIVDLPRVDDWSIAALREYLAEEAPSAVAVELDEQRLHWLSDREAWESLNLLELLKNKQGSLLFSYLALRIFQKRFGSFQGPEPGDEMCVAVEYARERELPIHLIDRHMKATALRAWRYTPFFSRTRLAFELTLGPFRRSKPRPEAEDPAALQARLAKVARSMPKAADAYLREREDYMAESVKATDSEDLVVVVSSAHAEEVANKLSHGSFVDRAELEHVPDRSLVGAMMPWLLSAGIVGLFVWVVAQGDTQAIQETLLGWLVINAIFTTIFTAAAMAHPVAILAAAVSSPLVSLFPAIGAGFVGAFVQAFLVPPTVVDIERVGEDITRLTGWWKNRLARLILIVVFANLGSTVGTIVALALFPHIIE